MSIEALYSRADGSDELVQLEGWTGMPIPRDELMWVDVVDPTPDDLALLGRTFDLTPGTLDHLGDTTGRPDAAFGPDGVDILVRMPATDLSEDPFGIRILLGDEWVITAHAEPVAFLEEHRERIQDSREVGLLTPIQFLSTLLDWMLDRYFEVAEKLERVVDELDDAALGTDRDLLQRLVRMRRHIARLRRLLTSHREVFAELRRPDFLPGIEDAERELLGTVATRLDRAADAIANVREMLIGTFDVHMTRTAQRTNDIMKVLTLASAILLPASVVAGVMGMNFKLAFFDEPTMFWAVLAGMLAFAALTIGFARWRRWL